MSTVEWWLTTERLALRRFTADDLDFLAALYADADVTRYLGGPRDRNQVSDLLRTRILPMRRPGRWPGSNAIVTTGWRSSRASHRPDLGCHGPGTA